MWSWWFDMTWFSDEQGLNNSLLFLSTLVVPVHSDEGEDDAVDVSLLRLFELITVKYPPAEWNDPRVYPVLHLLRVGQIVQLWVLLPLVSPVQPDADLQAEHEAHEARSHQHRTWHRADRQSCWTRPCSLRSATSHGQRCKRWRRLYRDVDTFEILCSSLKPFFNLSSLKLSMENSRDWQIEPLLEMHRIQNYYFSQIEDSKSVRV